MSLPLHSNQATAEDMTDYALLNSQTEALLRDEPDSLANAANFVALLYNALDDVNWLGIYVLRGDELVLGPFQGQPVARPLRHRRPGGRRDALRNLLPPASRPRGRHFTRLTYSFERVSTLMTSP